MGFYVLPQETVASMVETLMLNHAEWSKPGKPSAAPGAKGSALGRVVAFRARPALGAGEKIGEIRWELKSHIFQVKSHAFNIGKFEPYDRFCSHVIYLNS